VSGIKLSDVQAAQAPQLAGFQVIYAMSQHQEWVRKMNGGSDPYAIAAALLLMVPGCGVCSPVVELDGRCADLGGYDVSGRFHECAMPLLRKYGAQN
jgi:hypothetical protein